MKDYRADNLPLARSLRKNMTKEEKKLWYGFLREYPVRFQRQKPIGDYIVDFYCAKSGLAIELDGGGHYEPDQMERDRIRTERLLKQGVRVVRFTNTEVLQNFEGVCTQIALEVQRTRKPNREKKTSL